MYKFIKKWSDFILNETLKTHNIDLTIRNIETELSLQHFDFEINKINNSIELKLLNFDKIQNLKTTFDYLDSLFIDRHGWFPSLMKLTNISDKKNSLQYSQEYLFKNNKTLKEVIIKYESKYDVEKELPKFLYHLTIQQYESQILNNGLFPKSKNKLSKHLDRIYVCKTLEDCLKLIPMMNYNYERDYIGKNIKINYKWIVFKIDTTGLDIKLYQDPNFKDGYYLTDNIPSKNIQIAEKE